MNIPKPLTRVSLVQKVIITSAIAILLVGGGLVRMASAATPGFVQSKGHELFAGNKTGTVTLSKAATAGDLIAVGLLWDGSATATVTDAKGDSFAAATARTTWSGTASAQVFYAKNVVAGSTTVTVTFSTGLASFGIVQVHEYSGLDKTNPLDATSSAAGKTSSANSGNLSATGSSDMLFASGGAAGAVGAPPTGWTARLNTAGNRTADKVATAAGTYSITTTATGNNWVMQLVAFKADTGVVDTTAPSVPATLSTTASSSTQVNLSWPAATDNVGVTGYRVERCQGAACSSFAQVGTTTGATLTYSDTGLTASTSYSYRVRATDAAGNLGGYSPTATAATPAPPDTTPPSAPASLTATAVSSAQINLSWGAATDNVGVTGYWVERCQGVGCSNFQQFLSTGSGIRSYSDNTLSPGTSYSYRVRAIDAAINKGAYSPVATATTQNTVDTTAPSVPTGLNAAGVSISHISLRWNASTDDVGVVGYTVYRNGSVAGTTVLASFEDAGLAVNTSYTYTVSAYDAAGNNSAQSPVVTASTFPDTTAPTVPSSFTVQVISPTQINLFWNASTDNVGVTGYKVYRSGSLATSTSSTSFQDTGLTPGTTYTYTVSAVDAAGNESAQTAPAQATTPNPDTTAPTVAMSAPTDGSTVSGTVTVSADASDGGSGVHDVQFYLDGTALNDVTASPYTFQWSTTNVSNGSHQLTAVAKDNAGNSSSATAPVTVPVNNTANPVPNPLKIMPLGDSLTQGGVGGPKPGLDPDTVDGYRLNLWNLLTADGYHLDYVGDPNNALGDAALPDHDENGSSGACIKVSPCGGGTMYPQTAAWITAENPDLIIMQGGGNDYSNHSLTTADIEGYMESWIQLVWQTKPSVKIIVSGNTQYSPDLEALTKAYVENLQAQGKAIRFVPYGATVGTDANTLDGTHPNVNGYQVWANELAPMVQQLFPQ